MLKLKITRSSIIRPWNGPELQILDSEILPLFSWHVGLTSLNKYSSFASPNVTYKLIYYKSKRNRHHHGHLFNQFSLRGSDINQNFNFRTRSINSYNPILYENVFSNAAFLSFY